jgi:hypothetical protein
MIFYFQPLSFSGNLRSQRGFQNDTFESLHLAYSSVSFGVGKAEPEAFVQGTMQRVIDDIDKTTT